MSDVSSPGPDDDIVVDETVEDLLSDELDETDYRIYRILNEDGRISDTELGNRIGLSRTAVRRRRKQLQDDNIIKVLGLLVLQEADLDYADVQVTLDSDATKADIDEFVTYLVEQELIYEVDEYLGSSDMLVRVWHQSLRDIKEFVNEIMHHSDVVTDYEIVPVIKTHKAWHSRINNTVE